MKRRASKQGQDILTSVDGRFAAPAELTENFVGDEGFHHFFNVPLMGLGVIDFLMQTNHLKLDMDKGLGNIYDIMVDV